MSITIIIIYVLSVNVTLLSCYAFTPFITRSTSNRHYYAGTNTPTVMMTTTNPKNIKAYHHDMVDSCPNMNTDKDKPGLRQTSKGHNEGAQAIFQLIEKRYDTSIKTNEWSKTRRYIYHITSSTNTSKRKHHNDTSDDSYEQRLLQQINSVLTYLEQEFHHGSDSKLPIPDSTIETNMMLLSYVSVPSIIQSIPRILKKDVKTQIKPTVNFLKKLYNQKNINMFYTAIKRNPKLLLTNGVRDTMTISSNRMIIEQSDENKDKVGTEDLSSNSCIMSYLLTCKLGLTKASIHKIEDALATRSLSSKAIIEKQIDPIIQYLLSSIHCNHDNNNNMNNNMNTSQQPLLLDNIETSKERKIIGNMIAKNPKILTLNLKSNIIPKVEFLKSIMLCNSDLTHTSTTVQHVDNCILNIYNKFPSVLGLSLNDNIKPTVHLISTIIHSTILDVLKAENTTDNNLDYAVELQQQEEKIMKPDQHQTIPTILRKILMQHPQLLGLSLSNFKAKIDYFNSIDLMDWENKSTFNKSNNEISVESSLKLSSLTLASRVMISSPSVYSLSLKENIIPKIECLAHLWGTGSPTIIKRSSALTQDNKLMRTHQNKQRYNNYLGRIIGDYPFILTLSLEGNIQPTINFYNQTGYINLNNDGTGNDVYLPGRYLGSSLFNRLLPRWNYYIVEESKKIDPFGKIDKPVPLQLHLIASATDTQFCKQLGYDENLYTKFKAEAVPRLKFSSQFGTWLKTGRPIDL